MLLQVILELQELITWLSIKTLGCGGSAVLERLKIIVLVLTGCSLIPPALTPRTIKSRSAFI